MSTKVVKSKTNLIHQFKAPLPSLLLIYTPLLCIFLIIRLQTIVPIEFLTRDPLAVLEQPFYIGIVSQLGVLFWCACAAICLFSALLLRQKNNKNKMSRFLLFSGLFTTLLLIDDVFLVHDDILPLRLQIPEKIAYSIYLILFFVYLIKFHKIIRNTEFMPLLLAFVFFGISVLVDKATRFIPEVWLQDGGEFLLEDGAKLLGIVSWLTYFTRLCLTQMKEAIWHQQADVSQ